MPYIGNTAGNRFVASKTATQFSGNGSAVDFTLDHSVGSPEDILVSVDGVIQEPTVAYGIVSGTTLRFTAAPSSNAGNNIFVYYLFRTVATVTHPATSALSATSGTFTGDLTVDTNTLKVDSTNNRVGIGTTSPTQLLQVESSTNSAEVQVRLRGLTSGGGGRSAVIGFDPSSTTAAENHTFIGDGSSKFLKVDNAGHVTKPLQPAFLVKTADAQNNLALNQNTVIAFGTEIFDNNADFSSNVFTAPVTGRYQLNFHVRIDNLDSVTQYTIILLVTSNRNLQFIHGHSGYAADVNYMSFQGSHLVDMDANDTAGIQASLPSLGTAQADVSVETHFSGHLVC